MQNFTKEESSALLYLKLARDLGANNVNFDKSTCEVIINLVERLMQKANGGWISVEDRIPDNADRVLVSYRNFELKYNITYIDSYNGYGKWENFDRWYDKKVWKVTHWQPLPEISKIEGDKNEQQ
jgi:hypothetical protein